MNIAKLALEQEPYLVETRRWLHRHPELSWEETGTTERILAELNAMGG